MIGISIAANKEWGCVLERFNLSSQDCGISDFSKEVYGPEDMELFTGQYNTFEKNIPIIMHDIFDNYLEFALGNKFDWDL